ncbi:YecA family protein [Halobacillus trueperi]|uniref:YecA family protein n=1 Tax=Halobacillus trueperi TaxID=156205 RepID=UPI003736AB0B
MEAEEFEYSLKAYVAHVQRQIKKDDNYEPHPLVKALIFAVDNAVENDKPGNYAGISGTVEGEEDNPNHPFFVVVNYSNDKIITLLEVQDINLGKPVPIKIASIIILLALRFERIEGNLINVDTAIDIINDSIGFLNIVRFNNEEWIEARDYTKKLMEEGNFKLPQEMDTSFFHEVTYDTPWEEYPSQLRSLIASNWLTAKLEEEPPVDGVMNVVNVFLEDEYPKSKYLDNLLHMLYGEVSKYFNEVNELKSFGDLNFNQTPNLKKTKIGRNDPCPCNSGEKFKKCCKNRV